MTIQELDVEIAHHSNYRNLDRNGWETKILYRQAQRLFPEDLQRNIDKYVKKITAGRQVMANNPTKEDREYWDVSLPRLLDKLACCRKEQQLRKEGIVRSMHHTAYYIDYVNGSDAGDGLGTGTAWKTITKYTTTTVRTAGDIAYLRANITWLQGTQAVDIAFDESGTVDSYIKIIGCDAVTNDPWADASNVKPIVDFQNAAYQFNFNTDTFWWLERLDIRQSADLTGQISVSSSKVYLLSCDISDSGNSGTEGLYVWTAGNVTCESCTFTDCWATTVLSYANCTLINCTLDAGAIRGSIYACYSYSTINLIDCSIAPSNAFSSYELGAGGGRIYSRNTTFGVSGDLFCYYGGVIYLEDNDGTFEAHKTVLIEGVIDRDTVTVRSGGANSSAKMTPNSNCGPNATLQLGDPMSGFARVWATASQQINISVYACVDTAWDSALDATGAYAKFSYLSNGASAARTEVQSTETIANDETWTAFTSGNITPLQTGWVYIWFHVAEFEDASEAVLVDIKPVVS